MDRPGHELLAGAGLAEEEHGGVGGGHLLDLGEDAGERGARPDDLVEAPGVADLLLEDDVLRLQPLLELAHLPQARLERRLRLLELRHVRVHDHEPLAGRARRDGHEVVPALAARRAVDVARPDLAALPGEHRLAAAMASRASIRPSLLCRLRRRQVVPDGLLARPGGRPGGGEAPGVVGRDDLGRSGRERRSRSARGEDRAVEVGRPLQPGTGPLAVEGVGVDRGQHLEAGEELGGPVAGPRVVVHADRPEDLAAGRERQGDRRLEAQRRDDRALRLGLGGHVVGRPADDHGPSRPQLADVPRHDLREVGFEELPGRLRREVPVPEHERAPVLREQADATALAAEEGPELLERGLDGPVDVLRRRGEQASREVREEGLEPQGVGRGHSASGGSG